MFPPFATDIRQNLIIYTIIIFTIFFLVKKQGQHQTCCEKALIPATIHLLQRFRSLEKSTTLLWQALNFKLRAAWMIASSFDSSVKPSIGVPA